MNNYKLVIRIGLIISLSLLSLLLVLIGFGGVAQAAPVTLAEKSGLSLPSTVPLNRPLLEGSPVLTVTKSSVNEGDSSLRPGERITYTITISNSGNVSATNVTISDTFPADTNFVVDSLEISPSSAGGVPGTQPILADGITITELSLVTVTYAATVNASVADETQIVNTASITSNEVETPVTHTVTDTVVNQANLSISKTNGQDTTVPGTSITYTIAVTNSGPSSANGITVSDSFPASLTDVSWSRSGTGGSCLTSSTGNINCTINLPPGDSEIFTATGTVDPDATGSLVNTATLTPPAGVEDTSSGNDSATDTDTLTPQTDLQVSKSASSDSMLVYDPLTYTLTITNDGPSDAVGVVVTDTLPAGISFASASTTDCSPVGGDVVCNLGNLTNEAVMTVKLMVTPTVTGTLTNTAIVTSTTFDPASSNNQTSVGTTVNPKADLVIVKSDNNLDPVIAGTSLTYTLVVTNNGPSPAANVVVTDTLPLSVSVVSVTPATTTQNGQALGWDLGTLPNNSPQVITVEVAVNGSARGMLANTATVTTSITDPIAGNNSDTETTGITTRADLSVTKSDSFDPIGLGSFQGYTIQVANAGPSDAFGVILTDTLPGSVSLFGSPSPSQGTCSGTTTIICNLGKIIDGNGATITLIVVPNTPGVITNTVSVTSSELDPNSADNTVAESTVINPANLSVTKVASNDPILVGSPLTYTVTVANPLGLYRATNVTLRDNLPSSVTLKSVSSSQGGCSGTTTVTCNLNTLESGTNAIVTIVVTPTAAGLITNTASVTSSMPDPDSANNVFTLTTSVSPVANLQVTKTGNVNPVTAGDYLTYTLTITNLGPSPATGVVVTDDLPDEAAFQSATSSCNHSGGVVTCNLPGSLAKNAVVTASIRVQVNPTTPAGLITNTVSVTGVETDTNQSNNSKILTTTVNRRANLSVAKTASSSTVAAGSNLTYTLTIINNGPSSANGVKVVDQLPTAVQFISAAGCTNVGNVVTCTVANPIASGGEVPFSLPVTVIPSFTGTILTNTATVITGAELDLFPADNSSTITTTVNRQTDLSITSIGAPDPVLPGNLLTYNLTVVNNGPSDAVGVVVTQTLPAGVTFQSATPSQGTCTPGSVTCNLGNITRNGNATIAVVVKVDDSAGGYISSTAGVSGGGGSDLNTTNNFTTTTTFVGEFKYVFLPMIVKLGPTELSVFNDNTGGNVSFTVVGTGVSCVVPNNATIFCGSFPPGTYTVQVSSRCGNDSASLVFESGPVTKRVFCK